MKNMNRWFWIVAWALAAFWVVDMLATALAQESYIPVLNPIHTQAGRALQPGLVSTGNIDATTSTITAATILAGTANAQTVNVSAAANITSASFGGISTSGNAVIAGQGRFGTLYNAGVSTFGGNLTLSGSAANIALGNNYLSGDGGDEGVFVDSNGFVCLGANVSHVNSKLSIAGNVALASSGMSHASIFLFPYAVNNNGIYFDGYYNGGSYASSALGTFSLYKSNNELHLYYADAANIGDVISLTSAQKWDASNGATTISPGGTTALTIQSASYEVTGAVGNSAAIFDSVAIRSGVFQDGLKAQYKTEIKTLDNKPVDLKSTDEIPTIYRYKVNPEWFIEKMKHEVGRELLSATEAAEAKTQAADRNVVQEGFIREKLPERYHSPDGGINLSLIAQDALARVAALEKRVEALEGKE